MNVGAPPISPSNARKLQLDRVDGLAEDGQEQEDENPCRRRGEERFRRRLYALHAADRQAEEDRHAGDRAEPEGLGGAHVRLTLQARISQPWPPATRSK